MKVLPYLLHCSETFHKIFRSWLQFHHQTSTRARALGNKYINVYSLNVFALCCHISASCNQNGITIKLHCVELKRAQDTERCSAVQVDGLEKACRQQLAHCALLNKGSHFMTPPLGILILILSLAPPLSLCPPHLPSRCFLCHQKLHIFFSFVFEFSVFCLCPFTQVFLNTGSRVGVGLMWGWWGVEGVEAGNKCWPNQISKYPISHIDKLISVQIK